MVTTARYMGDIFFVEDTKIPTSVNASTFLSNLDGFIERTNVLAFNEDYPSAIYKTNVLVWFLNGKFHRLSGPAWIDLTSKREEYYILDIEISKEDFPEASKTFKEEGEVAFKLQYYRKEQ